MKRTIRVIVPIILILTILLGSIWYFFVYDRELTRDILLSTARALEKNGQSKISAWFYDWAYAQAGNDDTVAIEMADQYVNDGNFTQAERVLQKAINSNPTTKLYTKLSCVFLKQDKVLDAVQLLDNIRDSSIIKDLQTMRPAAPTASLESGQYNQYMDVSFTGTGGKLYVNAVKEYPSIVEDLYADPIRLTAGENHLYAVIIAENGLVSPLSKYTYTIMDVIEQVQIQDQILNNTIRQALGLTAEEPIFSNMLWELKTLTIPEGVTTFSELTHLRALQELTIRNAPENQLSFLSNLTNLKTLNVYSTPINNTELLSICKLPALESLTLNACSIGVIDNLQHATKLRYLDLSDNSVSDIAALANLSSLKELILYRNIVEDLSPLSGCSALEHLDISFNICKTLAPISALSSLKTLHADGNKDLTTLSFTTEMANLEYLTLSNSKISDITSIALCTGLKELDISNNAISNLAPVTILPKLIVLKFANNYVSTIPSFSKDCSLAIIDGSNNNISSISPLAGLMHLTDVIMDGNIGISSVYDLHTCHSLIKVSVANTSVGSVGILTERGIIVIK